MSGLSDLLNSDIGKQLIQGVARETRQSEAQTSSVLDMALPVLMGAMKKNASKPEGAQGLMNALTTKHSGGILDDLGGLFGGGVDEAVKKDGAGILGHVLGNKQASVESALSQRSGLDPAAIADMLKIAAPVVMGFLGRQSSKSGVSDSHGMNAVLGNLLGGQSTENQSLITSLLDTDGDGSVLDDVADMFLGNNDQKKGGIGGMLGGLFGK